MYECLNTTAHGIPETPVRSPFVHWEVLQDLVERSRDLVAELPSLVRWEYVRMVAGYEALAIQDSESGAE